MEKQNTNAQWSADKTKKLVSLGLLTAIVIVLQALSGVIKFGPFSITLALTPIIVGAALYGYKAGAWLGLVMGAVTLFDAAAFLEISVPATVAICLLKPAIAGLCVGLVYKALEKKNGYAAAVVSAIVAPVVNTGVFLLGCVIFFLDTITSWAGDANAFIYIITGLIGVNFIVELIANLVLSSVVVMVVNYAKGKKKA